MSRAHDPPRIDTMLPDMSKLSLHRNAPIGVTMETVLTEERARLARLGITPETYDGYQAQELLNFRNNAVKNTEEVCIICLQSLGDNNKNVTSGQHAQTWRIVCDADHIYHTACIIQWMSQSTSGTPGCPECRRDILDELQKELRDEVRRRRAQATNGEEVAQATNDDWLSAVIPEPDDQDQQIQELVDQGVITLDTVLDAVSPSDVTSWLNTNMNRDWVGDYQWLVEPAPPESPYSSPDPPSFTPIDMIPRLEGGDLVLVTENDARANPGYQFGAVNEVDDDEYTTVQGAEPMPSHPFWYGYERQLHMLYYAYFGGRVPREVVPMSIDAIHQLEDKMGMTLFRNEIPGHMIQIGPTYVRIARMWWHRIETPAFADLDEAVRPLFLRHNLRDYTRYNRTLSLRKVFINPFNDMHRALLPRILRILGSESVSDATKIKVRVVTYTPLAVLKIIELLIEAHETDARGDRVPSGMATPPSMNARDLKEYIKEKFQMYFFIFDLYAKLNVLKYVEQDEEVKECFRLSMVCVYRMIERMRQNYITFQHVRWILLPRGTSIGADGQEMGFTLASQSDLLNTVSRLSASNDDDDGGDNYAGRQEPESRRVVQRIFTKIGTEKAQDGVSFSGN